MPASIKYPSQSWFKRYLHYNQYTGGFTRIRNGDNGKRILGPVTTAKRQLTIGGDWYALSIIAWIYVTGEQPSGPIRHRDGDETNFKFDNLGMKGLAAHARPVGKRWQGYFYTFHDGVDKQCNAGMYDTEEEALLSAQAAAMFEKLQAKYT